MFIKENPENEVYYNLIDLAFDICDTFILVVRKDISRNENVYKILKELDKFLIEKKEQSKWISGELWGDTAYIYYYATDNEAKKIIKEVSNSLHQWVQPNFPEDLSFIKNNKAWLINTAHESESYIKTEDENELNKILGIQGLNIRM